MHKIDQKKALEGEDREEYTLIRFQRRILFVVVILGVEVENIVVSDKIFRSQAYTEDQVLRADYWLYDIEHQYSRT